MKYEYMPGFIGEMIGTAILVFFGCGAVAVDVLFHAFSGLWQIATVWGIAVALAIYATRHLSCAHLNPAISIAMVTAGRMPIRKLPIYIAGQCAGAWLAAALLYVLFADSIAHFESIHHIIRGQAASVQTAMIFGEFYPNPNMADIAMASTWTAFIAEGMGTFALAFMIFHLTEHCNIGRPDDALAPVLIGASVTMIITAIAPLTQAGLNPARDLAPRLFSMLVGWGAVAWSEGLGALSVYVLAPILGAITAALLFTYVSAPMMAQQSCNTSNKESL